MQVLLLAIRSKTFICVLYKAKGFPCLAAVKAVGITGPS